MNDPIEELTQILQDIADAIKTKKGSQADINAQDFATEIRNLNV